MVDYVADFTLEEQPEIEADFSIEVANTDHNTLSNRDLPNQHPMGSITGLDSALSGKQDVLTAGEGISIEDGVISATVQSAVWGNITGTLSDQTDLTAALAAKYDASNPDGYTTNIGTVTSVNNTSPDSAGNVTLSIPAAQVNSDWNADSGVAQILNKPTIPTVNDGTLTIQVNSTDLQTFTANQSSNATANITVPTDTGDLTNGAGFITNSALANYVTTDTDQNITGEKTFIGQKRIKFKALDSNTKLGFTAFDSQNREIGYLEGQGNGNSAHKFRFGIYDTNSGLYDNVLGFEYYKVKGSDNATHRYNLLCPSLYDSTTSQDFYIPIDISNGNTKVRAGADGIINISTLLPSVPTNISAFNNDSGYITSSALSGYVQNTATSSNSVTLFGTANTTSHYVNSMNIGFQSVSNGANVTAVGYNSNAAYYGAALGSGASAGGQAAVAIGYGAIASGISSIQIGYGTNVEQNTLYVGFYNSGSNINYKLLGSDGKVPAARLPIAASVSSVSTNDEAVGAKLFYDTCGDIETLINAL